MLGCSQCTLPHAVFEQPAAVAGDIKPEIARLSYRARYRKRFAGWEVIDHLLAGATTHGARCCQLFEKSWIERCHDLLSAQQQSVEMVALRNGLMQRGPIVDVVAFENGNPVKVVGEHPCRHQSCQTSADDDRLLPKVIRHVYVSMDDAHLICASIDDGDLSPLQTQV